MQVRIATKIIPQIIRIWVIPIGFTPKSPKLWVVKLITRMRMKLTEIMMNKGLLVQMGFFHGLLLYSRRDSST